MYNGFWTWCESRVKIHSSASWGYKISCLINSRLSLRLTLYSIEWAVFISVNVCMHVYPVRLWTCIWRYIVRFWTYIYIYEYMCEYTCISLPVCYVWIYVCMYVRDYVCMCICEIEKQWCVCVYILVLMCRSLHVYVNLYLFVNLCTILSVEGICECIYVNLYVYSGVCILMCVSVYILCCDRFMHITWEFVLGCLFVLVCLCACVVLGVYRCVSLSAFICLPTCEHVYSYEWQYICCDYRCL